jgi:hypothetical protein
MVDSRRAEDGRLAEVDCLDDSRLRGWTEGIMDEAAQWMGDGEVGKERSFIGVNPS